jgi:hypothetical protein
VCSLEYIAGKEEEEEEELFSIYERGREGRGKMLTVGSGGCC